MRKFLALIVLASSFQNLAWANPNQGRGLTPAPEPRPSGATSRLRPQVAWAARLGGEFADDSLSEAKIAFLDGIFRGRYPFSRRLSASGEAGVSLKTGSTQALFTEEFRPEQTIFLNDARVTWTPFAFLALHAGALSQEHYESPIFISGGTFPALAQEIVPYRDALWRVSLLAQQAIPTSKTFSNRSFGKEATPLLFTGTGRVEFDDPETFALAGRVTYFQFDNLTRGIARDSRFYGNTVLGAGVVGARFFYEFQGIEAGAKLAVPITDGARVFVRNSFIHNSKAAKSRNQANYVEGGIRLAFSGFAITPLGGWFRVEDDPSVAFYNSKRLAHNNRKGWLAGLELELEEERVVVAAKYVKADVLRLNPLQADRTYAEVSLATLFNDF